MAGNYSVDAVTVLAWHNDFRASHSLRPLTWSSGLASNATNWADHSASFPSCWTPTVPDQHDLAGFNHTNAWGSSNTTILSLFKTWTNEPITNATLVTANNATVILSNYSSAVGCAIGQNASAGCFAFVCVYQDKAFETKVDQGATTGATVASRQTSFVFESEANSKPSTSYDSSASFTTVLPPLSALNTTAAETAIVVTPIQSSVPATASTESDYDPYTDWFDPLPTEADDIAVKRSVSSTVSITAATSNTIYPTTTILNTRSINNNDTDAFPELEMPKLFVSYEDGKLIINANMTNAKPVTTIQFTAIDTKLNETILETGNITVSQDHRRDGDYRPLAYEIFNFRTCGIVAVITEFTVCNSNNYDNCPDQYLSSSRFTEMFDPTRVKGTGYTGQTCSMSPNYIPHYWIALPSVDMYGFDIGSKKSVDTGRDCVEYCAWIPECVGFVFSIQYQRCWFKSILNGWDVHLDSDRLLYVPTAMANSLIFGIDYWGNDIAEYAVTSNDACRNMCSRYANCETAVFRYDLSKCYVKSSLSGTPVINQYARLSFKPMNSLLLGVGTDHNLYWRDPEIPVWKIVGAGMRLLDIVQLSDWSLLAVGEDNKLYWTIGLFQSSGWSVVPGSGSVTRIALVAGGAYLVGIGMDCELYSVMISKGFNAQGLQGGFSWYHIGNTGCVKDVLQLPNGWIGGIGTDNKLYFKTSWDTNWQMAPNFNGEVTGLTVLKDQTLIGIGMDGSVWRMNSWDTGFPDGAPLTKSCCFISISTAW